jgi:hypothetical protein
MHGSRSARTPFRSCSPPLAVEATVPAGTLRVCKFVESTGATSWIAVATGVQVKREYVNGPIRQATQLLSAPEIGTAP